MTPTHELELTATIEALSTATLATDLAALMESGAPHDPQTWLRYHVIIDTLCKRYPEVNAAWEAWADAHVHLPERERERAWAGTAILPVVQTLANTRGPASRGTVGHYLAITGRASAQSLYSSVLKLDPLDPQVVSKTTGRIMRAVDVADNDDYVALL